MEVIEIVRAKVKNAAITEIDIAIAIEEVAEVIKNYCNIDEVPEALNFTHANMAVDLVKYTHESNNAASSSIDDIDPSEVSSLKIGDTQIALGGGAGTRAKTLKSHRADLDSLTMNYHSQLNKFRRMVW